MKRRNLPLTGAVGIAALATMVAVGLSAGKVSNLFGQSELVVELSHAAGLKTGDPVRVSGVKVGEVLGIELEDGVVAVTIAVDDDLSLGSQTRAALKVETLLGTEYISLMSAGSGDLAEPRIPVGRTDVPFDLQEVLGGLTVRVEEIDTDALAQSFRTVTEALDGAAPSARAAMDGVLALSRVVSQRDSEFAELLRRTASVSGVLADRSQTISTLVRDAGAFLAVLEQRRIVIDRLLSASQDLAAELVATARSTREDLGPALRELETTVETLRRNKGDLQETVRLYAPLLRYYTTVLGQGRWFDAALFGLTPQVVPDRSSAAPRGIR